MSIKQEAEDFLFSHYKKFYRNNKSGGFKTDFDTLYKSLEPVDDELFLIATKRHVLDHDKDDGGRNAGDYFPTSANLKKHIEICRAQRGLKEKTQRSEEYTERSKVPLGAKLHTVYIDSQWLRETLGKDRVECIPTSAFRCKTCGDSGEACFWYYKEKKTHVFLPKEFYEFSEREPEKAKLFELSSAICDECDYGRNKYNRYMDNPPRFRPAHYKRIKELAIARKQKGDKTKKIKARKDQATLDF